MGGQGQPVGAGSGLGELHPSGPAAIPATASATAAGWSSWRKCFAGTSSGSSIERTSQAIRQNFIPSAGSSSCYFRENMAQREDMTVF